MMPTPRGRYNFLLDPEDDELQSPEETSMEPLPAVEVPDTTPDPTPDPAPEAVPVKPKNLDELIAAMGPKKGSLGQMLGLTMADAKAKDPTPNANRLGADLARAGSTIGAAFARVKPNTEFGDTLEARGAQDAAKTDKANEAYTGFVRKALLTPVKTEKPDGKANIIALIKKDVSPERLAKFSPGELEGMGEDALKLLYQREGADVRGGKNIEAKKDIAANAQAGANHRTADQIAASNQRAANSLAERVRMDNVNLERGEVAGLTDADPTHPTLLSPKDRTHLATYKASADIAKEKLEQAKKLYEDAGGGVIDPSGTLGQQINSLITQAYGPMLTVTGVNTLTQSHLHMLKDMADNPESWKNVMHSGRFVAEMDGLINSANDDYLKQAGAFHKIPGTTTKNLIDPYLKNKYGPPAAATPAPTPAAGQKTPSGKPYAKKQEKRDAQGNVVATRYLDAAGNVVE